MSVSEEKKQEYLDIISKAIDGVDGADEGFSNVTKSASTLCDVNQIVNYNPNMVVVRNGGGNVIGYDYKYNPPAPSNPDSLGVNSNNDTGSYGYATGGGGSTRGGGAGRYEQSYYDTFRYTAGINEDDPQNPILKNMGKFVSGFMDASWAAVSALGKFGKKVASGAADYLEALNQDYRVNFGDLLTVSGNSGDTADAIRVLFGLDQNGNTTMYMDEDTIGALGILLRDNGFFESGSTSDLEVQPSDWPVDDNYTRFPLFRSKIEGLEYREFFDSSNVRRYYGYSAYIGDSNGRALYIVVSQNINPGTVYFAYARTSYESTSTNILPIFSTSTDMSSSTSARFVVVDRSTGYYLNYYRITSWGACTYNGTTAYGVHMLIEGSELYNMEPVSFIYNSSTPQRPLAWNYDGRNRFRAWVWYLCYGTAWEGGSAMPGVDDDPTATSPVDAITGADPHVVAENLYNNYPQVMGSPVLVNVMDDSCNQVTNRYFSVPISYSPHNLNINAPISGTVQVNPSFNPDISLDPSINIDRLIDQIVLQLQGSNAGEDLVNITIDPDDPSQDPGGDVQVLTPTIPNTGIGETPETQLPQVNVQGMWHVYNPSSSEVSALGAWLWSANIVDQIIRLFQNPLEAVIGLHAIFGEPHVSSSASIVVGNLTSTVSSRVVSSQYTQVDCGSVWLTEYFGNVFDYAPYTSVSLFLPFIGIVDLDVGDVMRAEIGVVYNIDVYTGACIAQVSVTRDGVGGVVYQYPGKCSVEYPISGASYSRMLQGVLGAAVSAVGSGIATGGNPVMGAIAAGSSFISGGEKIQVQRSGSFSGNAGAMGSKIPYLIIRRPQTNMAINFERYDGRGSNFSSMLSQVSGYTKCKEVHLNVPGAYKDELDEITRLLKEGVIFP